MYLVLTDVLDRYTSTLGRWADILDKAGQVQSGGELQLRQLLLAREHASISKAISARSGRFEQSAVGAVEFLNAKARESGVRIVSMEPAPAIRKSQTENLPISAVVAGNYHQIGGFVNRLESGGICFQVRRLDIVRAQGRTLKATIEGSAILFTGSGRSEE